MKKFFKKIFNWELWPFYVIYAPLGVIWLFYSIKARAFYFFVPTDPTLVFGGFEGETKKDIYNQLPAWCYPKTFYVNPKQNFEEARPVIKNGGLNYPFVVKPNIGMQGVLFRVIESEDQWRSYHSSMPVEYVVQEYVQLPMEFSVFYIRYPNETKGIVTGFILKDYMHVTGDGRKTLEELVNEHQKAMHRISEMRTKHKDKWDSVIEDGEKYYLSMAGNHNRGAKFINLHYEIDQKLCDVFDNINNASHGLYYGRYDLKCTSVEDLKQGKNVVVLKYNGTGAEPNHIYDCGMSYWKALKVVTMHWYHMYKIGKINHKNGAPYWSYGKCRQFSKNCKREFKKLQVLDEEVSLTKY